MQTCYNCGQQVADDVLICPNCGALVKRYTDAPRRAADAAVDDAPAQEQTSAPRGRVYTDANGKLRLSGGVKAWCIIAAVLCGYLTFSFGCLLFIYHNQDLYAQVFAMMSDLDLSAQAAQVAAMFDQLMAAVGQGYAFIVLLMAVGVLKLAADVWFLCAKRRAALMTVLVLCAVLAVLLAVTGYVTYALVTAADGLGLAMLLRKDRMKLKK